MNLRRDKAERKGAITHTVTRIAPYCKLKSRRERRTKALAKRYIHLKI